MLRIVEVFQKIKLGVMEIGLDVGTVDVGVGNSRPYIEGSLGVQVHIGFIIVQMGALV